MKHRKRIAALLMAGVMLFSSLPANALGAERQNTGSLCEHHPAHTAECGYAEGTEGTPCNHQHTDECYTFVTNCVHEHGEDCYPAEGVSDNAAAPSGAETAEPTACTHQCSEESGCISKELDCKHEHKVNGGEAGREDGLGRNSECGYTPATGGTPCTYVCPICPVQAQINALPTADELGNMTEEEQQAVYEKLQAAYDAYNALTDEQKEEIAGAEIFDSLFAVFNGMVNTLAEDPVSYISYYWDENAQKLMQENKETTESYTLLTADNVVTNWAEGWYVVEGTVNLPSRVTVTGEVHLILKNGCHLKADAGIQVTTDNSLTIYAQSEDKDTMGSLTATGGERAAGIGGGNGGAGENIIINGGRVTATGGERAAGIGSGYQGVGKTITINGGIVIATGGESAEGENGGAGIGGGQRGTGETITINGGTVTAKGGSGGAGIGGGDGKASGGAGKTITINSGTVTATGGEGGAGIGGGDEGAGETITINGGTVTATGGDSGAGIGGGHGGAGEGITINGGKIDATGRGDVVGGAGIGGGAGGAGKTITIEGGTVTAEGGNSGAGIGGGYNDAGEGITIKSGTVMATGGFWGAGIGGGHRGTGENITIEGETVTAAGGSGGAGIGGGCYSAGKDIAIKGGTVTATGGYWEGAGDGAGIGDGYTYNVSSEDITITNGSVKASSISITPTDGNGTSVYLAELAVQSGVNEVTLDSDTAPKTFKRTGGHPDGDTVDTTFYLYLTGQDHEITVSNTKYKAIWDNSSGSFTIKQVTIANVFYISYSWDENAQELVRSELTTTEPCTLINADNAVTNWTAGWYVVDGEVTLTSRVTVNGNVHLILKDGCHLKADAGIQVTTGNSLTIYAQSEDKDTMGSLTATGGDNNAGIGGSHMTSSDTITINGGTVTATGGYYGAGIGGGAWGDGKNITINGGTVTARGGESGAGIGGGYWDVGENITINGGKVTATGGDYGAGIGGGGKDAGKNITVNGGTVTATGGSYGAGIGSGSLSPSAGKDITINGGTVTATGGSYGAGIGGGYNSGGENILITNGSVKASSISQTPTDGNGNNVYLAKLAVQSGVNEVTLDSGAGEKTFKRAGDHPDGDTTFYLYLTGQDHEITISSTKYKALWNGRDGFDIKLAVSAPILTITNTTASSITVEELADKETYGGAEYSLDGANWQTSNVLTDLSSNTAYTVYARYKGDTIYATSDAGKVENVSTSAASYTITIPAVTLEAGKADSSASLAVDTEKTFDLGYKGHVDITVKNDSNVTEDAELKLTRQNDTGNRTITSALLVNGSALGNISNNVATFKAKTDTTVTISFASPTETNILAGTYKGTINFVVSYSE